MKRPRWLHILKESGLCIDSVRLLQWLGEHDRWSRFAARYLRLRISPGIIEDALHEGRDVEEKAALFSLGMSRVNIGHTYKTTGMDRTVLSDGLLHSFAEGMDKPDLLEVGVSDGSSALGLLARRDLFGEVHLTDRFPFFHVRRFPLGCLYLNSEGCLLGVKFLCFYFNLATELRLDTTGCERLETINPLVADKAGIASIEPFDMFKDRLDSPVGLIKCANIINSTYFTSEQAMAAIHNLSASLKPGGYMVISQNNEKYAGGEAVLALRKNDTGFVLVEDVNDHDFAPLLRERFGGAK